ncbi:ribosomal protein S18-alanine N-acetyltransferase [Candidatus Bathyarchaeota archaeon]|nr:ribosomal protein S18-alanine N-acetyltransferase [Candidatus Bathyarchaeota archaeon]
MSSHFSKTRRSFPITIREAGLKDLDEIYKIETECFAEEAFTRMQLEYCLRSPIFITLIAEVDNEAVGFIIGAIEYVNGKASGHIYTIDVKHKFRRMKVGSVLLKSLEKEFLRRGARRAVLEVRLDNTAAVALYLKHGYSQVRIVKDYYGSGLDAAIFEKNLQRNENAL